MSEFLNKMIENNKQWINNRLNQDEYYFSNLAKGQSPQVLWFGCADSRVPATEITGTGPGDLFVHRNVANLIVPNDVNMLSVLEYSVHHLKVDHIIVCGHYGCGGVQAAMSNGDFGIINEWIRPIKEVYHQHIDELESIEDDKKRFDRMVELNAINQVQSLAKTSVVQNAWKEAGRDLTIHAWVFDLGSGKIIDLKHSLSNPSKIDEIFQFD